MIADRRSIPVQAVSAVHEGGVQKIDRVSIRVRQPGANGKEWGRVAGVVCAGLTTKVHAMVDANGLPIAPKLMGLARRTTAIGLPT